ncbi:probable receptor-like protein kinase At2g23200 isoform X2 [Juglans microcarpa x Juglans regia]|uniref:probable receptor-like protein kinase At2g23200 isoform X1 n=1 Tax=Juglans microcarpa x Juglans regia TaxID=2249226 RepID=UPI001B7F2E09|nr:probable receptor-like protein kinase At2g23200 isoform X1 [Juglans microcarpa x Juglans regia]XP_040999601.1 probable receptor-like protein kinase At2g23200 isoform X2 [Juglans microcarpa x Juglans regia]
MEVLPSHKLLFRRCLLVPLQITSLLFLSSAYSPPDNFFINCGAHSNTSVDTRVFVGDRGFIVGKGETVKNSNSSASSSPLYQTAKVFKHPSLYRFDINQDGTYIVRLHFFVFLSHTDLSVARFNVSVSGLSFLTNYSFRNVTSSPRIEEFLLAIPEGEFKIYFIPYEPSSAFVNAIEVFLGPESIIPDKAPHITSLGAKSNYTGLSSKVLHKIHRIDVGGSTSKLDELWRNWDSDDKYLYPKDATYQYKGETPNNQTERIPKYIAPAFVYQTIRRLNIDGSSNSSLPKVTWSFPVNKNSNNFLRVHFSDIISVTPNDWWFNLYINRNFSKEMSPYGITETIGIVPFYIDFVVDSDGLGFVNVSIGPVEGSRIYNALLTGLEIMEVVKESGFIPPREIEVAKKKLSPAIIIGPACFGAFFILVLLVALGLKFRKPGHDQILGVPLYGGFSSKSRLTQRGPNASLADPSLNLSLRVPFSEILRATNNFNAKLLIGEGGFGKVYKGTLKNGTKVAVKRSDPRHGQGREEFQTEITVLSQIRHRHLVSLIGYCDERREMILVYEFMENGTLRDHLYHSNNNSEKSTSRSEFSWKQRLEICIGAAKGLHYLHTGAAGGIIHRDVKSSNILLDERYVAKVTDFGLSKSGLDSENFTMGVKGSFGYLDPKYLRTLQLTKKSDVYSFGVVLLEVLCSRPAIIQSSQYDEVSLADWGMLWQRKGQLEKIIDPVLVGNINQNSLKIFGDTVEKCLKAFSTERPTMQEVLFYLNYALRLQETGMPRESFEDSATITTSLELQFPVILNFSVHEDDDAPIGGDDSSNMEVSEV